MRTEHHLGLNCGNCQNSIRFSTTELEKEIKCLKCEKKYIFSDEINQKLKLFESLCIQLEQSKAILPSMVVGINVGNQEAKVPYNVLLTCFNSTLELKIDQQLINFRFHLENPAETAPYCVTIK